MGYSPWSCKESNTTEWLIPSLLCMGGEENQKSRCWTLRKKIVGEAVIRWWRNRMGDHFLPHKFIKRTFKRWVNSTKQLLNAGRGHQAPRKAAHCLWKEVGKTIKDKERDKRGRDRAPSQEGSLKKREVSKHQETLSLLSLWQALEPQRAT